MTSWPFHWGLFDRPLVSLFFLIPATYCCCMNYFMQEAEIGILTLISIGRLRACLHVVIPILGHRGETNDKGENK